MEHKKALIAMSGGVDSSVAAYLAQQAGLQCIGGTMQLLCQSNGDAEDARAVAQRMGMDFHIFQMTEQFRQQVMDKFVRCYEEGLTPNPCVDCNRHLKFGALLEQAQAMGCDYVVTGHYCRIEKNPETGRYNLYKAKDASKDQSYFLYTLTQQQLSHTLFPLGAFSKEEARLIAQEQGFLNARKRDSQDICFIPDGDYMEFIRAYTQKEYPDGDFLDANGKVVGRHHGAIGYTRGQRKGLGLAMGQPVYVCSKDMQKNTVTVGSNEALFSTTVIADDWNFIPFEALNAPLRCMAKARSRMTEQPATVYPMENGRARVVFDDPQRALTTGQAVVLYDGDAVLGGGTIIEIE
ncbi:MAG: tRNA 2-thiouridine(34) synthase MnmA [Oscillospiraceae bacterium]|nr:tRNA 2-thiouridine(34) synthase MnmA [Oscillospiraceae bacterium]